MHPPKNKLYTDPEREQDFCMLFGGRCNVLNEDGSSVAGFRYYNDVVLFDIGKHGEDIQDIIVHSRALFVICLL